MAGHNDSKGYEKGAKGIDGKEGEKYTEEGRSIKAERAMYGRSWSAGHGKGWGKDEV
jgi:hypothetical protein